MVSESIVWTDKVTKWKNWKWWGIAHSSEKGYISYIINLQRTGWSPTLHGVSPHSVTFNFEHDYQLCCTVKISISDRDSSLLYLVYDG